MIFRKTKKTMEVMQRNKLSKLPLIGSPVARHIKVSPERGGKTNCWM
jgi:hypothetical protein